MTDDLQRYELFLRYIKNQFSELELIDFRNKLTTDPEFKQAFEDFELARNFMLNSELIQIKHLISETAEKQKNSKLKKTAYGGLGLLAVGAIGGYFYFSTPQETVSTTRQTVADSNKIEQTLSETNSEIPTVAVLNEAPKPTVQEKISTPQPAEIVANDAVYDSLISATYVAIKPLEEYVTNISQEQEKEVEEPIIFPCATMQIITQTQPACSEAYDGSITIKEVQNAKQPLSYALDKNPYSSQSTFQYLAAGIYAIQVKDADECSQTLTVRVEEKFCMEKHYELSYAYQSYWNIPLKTNGTVKVLNRMNVVVAEFPLSPTEETFWDGRTINNEKLPSGLYAYIIVTVNKETYTGSIRILE